MKHTLLLTFTLLLLLLAACTPGNNQPTAATPSPADDTKQEVATLVASMPTQTSLPPVIAPVSPTAGPALQADATGLKPADSDTPAAGICGEAQGDPVEVLLGSGADGLPLGGRCLILAPDQRLNLVNRTGDQVAAQFAGFMIDLPVGGEMLLDRPVGEYLAPGVHDLPGISAPELWLKTPAAALAATPPILPLEHTPEPGQVELLQQLYALTQPSLIESQESPAGRWRAEVLRFECTVIGEQGQIAMDLLRLVDLSDGAEQTVDMQIQYCGGLGAFGLGGLSWSDNGRFLFYTNAHQGEPDGGCGPWYRPLIRYDTTRNVKQSLGGGLRSPDGLRYASLLNDYLQVWDLNEADGQAFPALVPDQGYTALAWAPDSSGLVYLINGTQACIPSAGDPSYLVRVDLFPPASSLLVQSGSPSFGGVAWEDPAFLQLSDENGALWRYTFATQELRKGP
jgi:hypothetical protein